MIIWENKLLLLAGVSKFNVVTVFSSNASLDNLAWLREEYICCSRGLRVKWGRPHQVNHKSYSHLVPLLLLLLPSTGRCFSPPITTPNNIPFQNERRRVQSLGRKFDMDALITHPSFSLLFHCYAPDCLTLLRWIFVLVYTIRTQFSTLYLRCFERMPFLTLLKFPRRSLVLTGPSLRPWRAGSKVSIRRTRGASTQPSPRWSSRWWESKSRYHKFLTICFHAPGWSTFIHT